MGISALTLVGLNLWLEMTLPVFFMLSTCSAVQLSMVKLLTLETCVPSLRCSDAQRTHRNMPRFQLAHPGFFAAQSAQRSLPGTVAMRSWRVRSLRACCRLDTAAAMVSRVGDGSRR